MRLENWNISVISAHRGDLRPNTLGNVHWYEGEMSAVIRVLDVSEYQSACRLALDDMEFTLVHELLHLKLSSLPRSEASRNDEEFAVNHLAEALLRLDRRR